MVAFAYLKHVSSSRLLKYFVGNVICHVTNITAFLGGKQDNNSIKRQAHNLTYIKFKDLNLKTGPANKAVVHCT